MRPVDFIWKNLDVLQKNGKDDKAIYETLQQEEFQKIFREEFPDTWVDAKEVFAKLYRELKCYDKIVRQTETICINGNECDLQYAHQCQECGTIIINDHGSDVCIDYDLICPTCNEVEKETPFTFYPYGTVQWIHNMRFAELIHGESEEGDDFMAGSVFHCKYRTTRIMRWSLKRDYYIRRIKKFFNVKEK